MKKLLRSIASVAVVAAFAGGALVGFAGSASAAGTPPWEPIGPPAQVGGLLFFNSAGAQITGGLLSAQPLAAYVEGTATIQAGDTKATLYGYLPVDGEAPGTWSGEAIGSSTTYPNSAAPAPLGTSALPVETGGSSDESVAILEADLPNGDTSSDGYANMYVLRLKTTESGVTASSSYDSADIEVNNTSAAVGGIPAESWAVVYTSPSTIPTTTGLTTSPTSPQNPGTSVTLTATVSPAAVPGSVQFENGTTAIGSPVAVSGGTASISTSTLPSGSDTLNAVFTPSLSYYSSSTGTASYTINSPIPTATALAAGSNSIAFGASDTLTATVTESDSGSAGVAGSVQFDVGSSALGSPVTTTVSGTTGTATLSTTALPQGSDSITAEFTPTSISYASSTSSAVVVTVAAPAACSLPGSSCVDTQNIEVTVNPGTITITTPYTSTSPFVLPPLTLSSDGTYLSSSATFPATGAASQIVVTSQLSPAQAWTVSVAATSLSSTGGGSIPASGLGLTNGALLNGTGTGAYTGSVSFTNIPALNPSPVDGSGTGPGLGAAQTWATSTAADGTAEINGTLTLYAATSTPAGTYTGTITFSVS
jgi:Bacterial Ig-like domain (group 3)